MKKLLITIGIGALLSAGCNQGQTPVSHIYREPNTDEINKFVPYGYQLHKLNDYQTTGDVIKANLDSDADKEIVLLMDAGSFEDNSNPPKLMVIKYNHDKDTWDLLKNIDFKDYASIGGDIQVTDLDNNGIDEVHFGVSISGADGYTTTQPVVMTMQNGNLINLFPEKATYNYQSYYDEQNQTYNLASFIWADNEGHFGCHTFEIIKYKFSGNSFSAVSDYKTVNKYYNDTGVLNGCHTFSIYDKSQF